MTTEDRFQSLVEQHKGILYKVCRSYCRNAADRDDLVQEMTIQLWRSFGSYDERYRFSTWMYRVALNVAISFYRRESTRVRHVVSTSEPLLDIACEAPHQTEELAVLYRMIQELEPLNKALVLLYLDGHSYQEIGEVLGLSETNVATKISRLKKTLKEGAGK